MPSIQSIDCIPSPSRVKQFVVKWGPRTIVAALAAYYALGFAYALGLMAAVDRIAIACLKRAVGYAGIGALMPTFQWYAAWCMRIAAAAIAGLLYDLAEKAARLIYCKLFPQPEPVLVQLPKQAPLYA